MILHINDTKTVGDLQEKFSLCFPALCLHFYKRPHGRKEKSSWEDHIASSGVIGDIRKHHEPGDLQIFSNNTVADVEKTFRERFGLNVQIFRKENNCGVQTCETDGCTLREQSEMSVYATGHLSPMTTRQYSEYEDL